MNRLSPQEWVHWLEMGAGAALVRRIALGIGVLLFSIIIAYKQFHGPKTETTLAQAVVGHQLASGHGFTTRINYPQTYGLTLEKRERYDAAQPYAELHQPPLYSAVIGGVLAALPDAYAQKLWHTLPEPPDGFGPDYVLLVLNVALLWLAAWQTWRLGRLLFDDWVGLVAALGLLFSASIWTQTVAVNGAPLTLVVGLALMRSLVGALSPAEKTRRLALACVATGIFSGLLFMSDYAAWVALPLILIVVALRGRATGGLALRVLAVAAGFALVAGPWLWRNQDVSGRWLAFADDNVALKKGDPQADPETLRTTVAALAPSIDLDKLGNKGLTALRDAFTTEIWSGGALVFAAFALAGLLYRFRSDDTERMRWVMLGLIATLLAGQAFFDSGEAERKVLTYTAPWLIILGAGFLSVLIQSHDFWAAHAKLVAVLVLALQALPLAHDMLEPRRIHFQYPPYYPALFYSLGNEMQNQVVPSEWMADTPAGAAWYSGRRVWARPATLQDFYRIGSEVPVQALALTSETFDQPILAQLAALRGADVGRASSWTQVYAGLYSLQFPPAFPLQQPHRIADNLWVLLSPTVRSTTNRR